MKRLGLALLAAFMLSGCMMNTNRVKEAELQFLAQQTLTLANDNNTAQTVQVDWGHDTKAGANTMVFNTSAKRVQALMAEYLNTDRDEDGVPDGTITEQEMKDLLTQDRNNTVTYMKAQEAVRASRDANMEQAAGLKERGRLLADQILEHAAFTAKEREAVKKLWLSAAQQGASLAAGLATQTPDTPEDATPPDAGTIPVEEKK